MDYEYICNIVKGKFITKLVNDNFEGKFVVDSRLVNDKDCFIAINSGYKYVSDAIENGAKLIITEKQIEKDNVNIIKVDNIIDAIGLLGLEIRKRNIDKSVVAITGSVGKTTTKELVGKILENKYRILKTEGNMNNEIGVPITLFNLDDNYEICVLELGMNHLKEISYLSKIIKPNDAVITNVGSSHIGYLKSKKNILKAKSEILDGMDKGTLFINGDDKYLRKIRYKEKYCVGINENNDLIATDIITTKNKLYFNIRYDRRIYNVTFNIPCKDLVSNVLLAIAVGLKYDVDINEIIKSISDYKPVKHRNNILKLSNNIILIDDCYNCSYESFKSGIEQLKHYDCQKLIIFGDILELGKYSKRIHKKIGTILKKNKYESLLVGKESFYCKNKYSISFKNNSEVINYLEEVKLNNVVIYIKGSRKMKLDEIRNYIINMYE